MSPQGLAYIYVLPQKVIRLNQKTFNDELTTRHAIGRP